MASGQAVSSSPSGPATRMTYGVGVSHGIFARISQTLGYPGPAIAADDEAVQMYTIPNMFAKYCSGRSTLDDAVREADTRQKAILAKYKV